MFLLVGCHSLQGFSLVHFCSAQVLRHSAGEAAQAARDVPISRLPLTYSSTDSKKCSHWSAATHLQQHRQQEMFPLVGCHSLQGFSLVHFCCAQVLCHGAGAAAQARDHPRDERHGEGAPGHVLQVHGRLQASQDHPLQVSSLLS